MLDTTRAIPVPGDGSELDLKIYNVVAYFGYVESWKNAPLIFQNISGGHTDVKEALLDLYECLASCIHESIKNNMGDSDSSLELSGEVREFLLELQRSTNDDQPGGYDLLLDLEQCGWTFQGKMVTGVVITINESAEELLSNKDMIEKHVDVFEGKTVYRPLGTEMSSCITLAIQTIAEIPPKPRVK